MTTASASLPVLAHTDDCTGTCTTCPAVGSCADRLVCRCLKVTEETIIAAIQQNGLTTIKELKSVTGAGDGCMCCHRELKTYLTVYSGAIATVGR